MVYNVRDSVRDFHENKLFLYYLSQKYEYLIIILQEDFSSTEYYWCGSPQGSKYQFI